MTQHMLPLDEVLEQVLAHPRYRSIDPGLVRRIAESELRKGRSLREAVKATRSKLHQVAAAYLEETVPYGLWLQRLRDLPGDINHPHVRNFCLEMMRLHASTRERLPYLETFYRESLAPLGSVTSILDLGCGLNPLALPWMPIVAETRVLAWDIFDDMVDFLNAFFEHFGIHGRAVLADLTAELPQEPVQLALLLKLIPCLEQLDKRIGARLLEEIRAEYLLISFPAHSLCGRAKGMRLNYARHFDELIAGKPWRVWRFDFPGEIAFLVHKGRE